MKGAGAGGGPAGLLAGPWAKRDAIAEMIQLYRTLDTDKRA